MTNKLSKVHPSVQSYRLFLSRHTDRRILFLLVTIILSNHCSPNPYSFNCSLTLSALALQESKRVFVQHYIINTILWFKSINASLFLDCNETRQCSWYDTIWIIYIRASCSHIRPLPSWAKIIESQRRGVQRGVRISPLLFWNVCTLIFQELIDD